MFESDEVVHDEKSSWKGILSEAENCTWRMFEKDSPDWDEPRKNTCPAQIRTVKRFLEIGNWK